MNKDQHQSRLREEYASIRESGEAILGEGFHHPLTLEPQSHREMQDSDYPSHLDLTKQDRFDSVFGKM